MIKLIAGKYGPKLLGPDTILNLSKEDEERMVKRKVAVYINSESDEDETNKDKTDEIKYLSVEELNKIKSKKELIKYAEQIGLHDLNESDGKDVLVAAIANYLEENFEQE